MSQDNPVERPAEVPCRLHVEFGELSSKQRGAVLGILKDTGFSPGEIQEIVVALTVGTDASEPADGAHRKRK